MGESSDHTMGEPYVHDIIKYERLRERRLRCLVAWHTADGAIVRNEYRLRIINWLMEVCKRLRCCLITTFAAIDILDRSMQVNRPRLEDITMLATVSLFIASKLHDVAAISLADIVAVSCFSKKKILEYERTVIYAIGFELNLYTVYDYIVYYMHHIIPTLADRKTTAIAKLIGLQCQLNVRSVTYLPSLLAAACVAITCEILCIDFDMELFTRESEHAADSIGTCTDDVRIFLFLSDTWRNNRAGWDCYGAGNDAARMVQAYIRGESVTV